MTLRMLPRLLEMHQTESYNNAYPFLIDIQAQTLAAFAANQRTAANIIGYWCDRILGYRPEPTYTVAVDFLRQNVAAERRARPGHRRHRQRPSGAYRHLEPQRSFQALHDCPTAHGGRPDPVQSRIPASLRSTAMTHINRRDFLKGCSVAALASGASGRAFAYFAAPGVVPATATNDTLVIVFLRGAMDGLSLLPPGAASPYRADYEAARHANHAHSDLGHRRRAVAEWHELGPASARDRPAHPVQPESPRLHRRRRPDPAEPGHAQPFRCAGQSRVRIRRRHRHQHRLADPASGQRRPARARSPCRRRRWATSRPAACSAAPMRSR